MTGEAVYCDDVSVADCLHMSLVLSTKASATIDTLDASEALGMTDVVAFVCHKDVPGDKYSGIGGDAPIFAIDKVRSMRRRTQLSVSS